MWTYNMWAFKTCEHVNIFQTTCQISPRTQIWNYTVEVTEIILKKLYGSAISLISAIFKFKCRLKIQDQYFLFLKKFMSLYWILPGYHVFGFISICNMKCGCFENLISEPRVEGWNGSSTLEGFLEINIKNYHGCEFMNVN